MDISGIKDGMRVTVTRLESTQGMLVVSKHMSCRTVGVSGKLVGWVAGHGGDVWWVMHDGSTEGNEVVGAYSVSEFEPEGN